MQLSNLRSAAIRHWAASSSHPAARTLRGIRTRLRHFTLPAPRLVVRPYLAIFLALRAAVFFLRRILVAEPFLKAYCTRFGRGVTTGIYVPWVHGRGELVLGDYVHISGKLNITFAARFVERPRLAIGDHSDIAHDVSFVVGREIRLGSHVQVARSVSFRDAGGHHSDPALRRAGAPPDPADVKPIIVHDNVWIGTQVLVLPGTEIGEGSIVAAHSVVSGRVAPYTIVAGNPARRIGTLTPVPGREDLGPSPAARPAPLPVDAPLAALHAVQVA
ncbi:acyltransferase [Luteimonas saliphila]|uniref:acyltransferase n=1 Tax=Luteimonas saliphila TaxID=2804919 RepID=UPI00192D518B|nr:acyltransferase [Luteimonas saliphila]